MTVRKLTPHSLAMSPVVRLRLLNFLATRHPQSLPTTNPQRGREQTDLVAVRGLFSFQSCNDSSSNNRTKNQPPLVRPVKSCCGCRTTASGPHALFEDLTNIVPLVMWCNETAIFFSLHLGLDLRIRNRNGNAVRAGRCNRTMPRGPRPPTRSHRRFGHSPAPPLVGRPRAWSSNRGMRRPPPRCPWPAADRSASG